jgi:hypothetical protein
MLWFSVYKITFSGSRKRTDVLEEAAAVSFFGVEVRGVLISP